MPPPLENWTIMGELAFFAASMHALMIGDIVQLTAGIAYLCFFACSRTAW